MTQTPALCQPRKPEGSRASPMTWTANELTRKIAKAIPPLTALSHSFNCSLHKKGGK